MIEISYNSMVERGAGNTAAHLIKSNPKEVSK